MSDDVERNDMGSREPFCQFCGDLGPRLPLGGQANLLSLLRFGRFGVGDFSIKHKLGIESIESIESKTILLRVKGAGDVGLGSSENLTSPD